MALLCVRRLHALDESPGALLQEIEVSQNTIRQTAEQFFRTRGNWNGSALDDWLHAERQAFWAPQAELKETDTAIYVLIGLPGLELEQIEVTLLPEEVILQGSNVEEDDVPCRIHFSEFGNRKLFRRIALPAPIHVASAVVSLEKNLLKLSAAKVETEEISISVANTA